MDAITWTTARSIRWSRCAQAGTLLVQRHVEGIAHGEFRRRIFDEPGIEQECMLVHGNAHLQYALGLARTVGRPAFTMDELFHFRQMVDLLFPMFELHAHLRGAARGVGDGEHRVAGGLRRAPRTAGRAVSRREHEICRLMPGGRSVPEAAQQLDVKLSTAESYVKRVREARRARAASCSTGCWSTAERAPPD